MPKIMHINFLLLLVLMTTAIKVAGYQPQRKLLLPQSRTCQSLTHGTSSRIHSALPALKLDAVNEPKISAGIGLVGLSVLLLNRLLLPADAFVVSDGQLRADIVAIFACSALLLNVLSEDDITAREREPVALAGYAFKDPVVSTAVSITVGDESRWLINSIMQHTPATSVAILNDSKLTAVGGVLGLRNARFEEVVVDVPKSPILRKALEQGEETYLPDLQVRILSVVTPLHFTAIWCAASCSAIAIVIADRIVLCGVTADLAGKAGILVLSDQLPVSRRLAPR